MLVTMPMRERFDMSEKEGRQTVASIGAGLLLWWWGSAFHETDLRLEQLYRVSNSKIIPIYSLVQVHNTMSDYTTLPLQAHDNRSMFLEHAWNIGRAYRNQAIELISICQLLSRLAPPKFVHEDAELRR